MSRKIKMIKIKMIKRRKKKLSKNSKRKMKMSQVVTKIWEIRLTNQVLLKNKLMDLKQFKRSSFR